MSGMILHCMSGFEDVLLTQGLQVNVSFLFLYHVSHLPLSRCLSLSFILLPSIAFDRVAIPLTFQPVLRWQTFSVKRP